MSNIGAVPRHTYYLPSLAFVYSSLGTQGLSQLTFLCRCRHVRHPLRERVILALRLIGSSESSIAVMSPEGVNTYGIIPSVAL